jgi:hypothetical protein
MAMMPRSVFTPGFQADVLGVGTMPTATITWL